MKNLTTYNGLVVRSTGSWYDVERDNSRTRLTCRIKGKFRLHDLKITNPVAVGDRVQVEMEPGLETGLITAIAPRSNYVVRSSPRKKHYMQLLACNIDQAVLITTIRNPNVKLGFIDRFLLLTEPYNIPTTIVFNKADLYDEGDMELYRILEHIYTVIGYSMMLVSATEADNLDILKQHLAGKLTLISGHSGVGKTTLINAIEPGLNLRTGDISDYSGKGQHTTTFAEMFRLSVGGAIIDTPGIKSLTFTNMSEEEVAHNFREFFRVSAQCKFANCRHMNEPGCRVKELVESADISPIRYQNYLQIIQEIRDQNYWELNTQL